MLPQPLMDTGRAVGMRRRLRRPPHGRRQDGIAAQRNLPPSKPRWLRQLWSFNHDGSIAKVSLQRNGSRRRHRRPHYNVAGVAGDPEDACSGCLASWKCLFFTSNSANSLKSCLEHARPGCGEVYVGQKGYPSLSETSEC